MITIELLIVTLLSLTTKVWGLKNSKYFYNAVWKVDLQNILAICGLISIIIYWNIVYTVHWTGCAWHHSQYESSNYQRVAPSWEEYLAQYIWKQAKAKGLLII